MKIKKVIFAALLLLAGLDASAQQIDPLTKAILKGYEELLQQNPKDYQTYLERAAQYYQLSLYDKAFSDITKAIEYTPEKETTLAQQEFSLLSDIAVAVKDYQKALSAVDKALIINPNSYPDLYRKGNVLLYLDQPEEAYKTFKSMQRLKSRSQEASFGMAKAAIMMGNVKEAEDLIKQAAEFDPTNYLTYCRLGDLYHDMKQDENACTNYLMAFSLARDPQRPLQGLVNISRSNYPAFTSAIDYAISRTDNKIPLYFIKANVAFNSGHFAEADNTINSLLAQKEGREASVYSMKAATDLALNRPEDALKNIDLALQTDDREDYHILKSKILRAENQPANAILEARKALQMNPNDTEAMLEVAEASIDAGDGQAALEMLNELVISDPENIEALLLRGYVKDSMLGKGKEAVTDYNRAANFDAQEFPSVAYKALAKAKAGKKIDADSIIEKALTSANDKDAFYMAALYYSQTGNLEKASEILNKAIAMGYENQFNLKSAKTANLNIAPIRHLLK